MIITKFTIIGERCSGTNYLEALITTNFGLTFTKQFGWKHWMPWNTPNDSINDTLVVGIDREFYEWVNSLYMNPHHLHPACCKTPQALLTSEIVSHNPTARGNTKFINTTTREKTIVNIGNEVERWDNVYDMHKAKSNYVRTKAKSQFPNYLYVSYEYLTDHWDDVMRQISNEFSISPTIDDFPRNHTTYKKTSRPYNPNEKKPMPISHKLIQQHRPSK